MFSSVDIPECASDPCMNGATCFEGTNGYQCQCPMGYEGDRCETRMLACPSSPCLNGATCFDRQDTGDYVCICPTGYEGDRCEIDIDYCATEPCLNGATCVDQVEGYQCQCSPGWQGENCEQGKFISLKQIDTLSEMQE